MQCLGTTAMVITAGCVGTGQVERSRNRVDFTAKGDYVAIQKVIHEKSLVMVMSVGMFNMNTLACQSDPQAKSAKVVSFTTNGLMKQTNMVVTITQESAETCNVAVCTLTGLGSSKNWAAPAVEKWLRDEGLLLVDAKTDRSTN